MRNTSFILVSKKALTHDVFELIYSCPDMIDEPAQVGQYVLFQLAPGLARAYSFAHFSTDTFTLIIKRIPDGRGSPIICDAPVGTEFSGILPLGHFLLRQTSVAKCFIGTGTGFAPLYCQLLATSAQQLTPVVAFIFGVREQRDQFYDQELRTVMAGFSHGTYVPYFSRETLPITEDARSGYVTDWITADNIATFGEFYICGSPVMVKGAREKLEHLGITRDQIFWEQF